MPDDRSNTTNRENNASFDDWNFQTGLPDGDALQRMCRNAARFAIEELVKDVWLMLHFSSGRDAPAPDRFELCIHAWDGAVTLGRPFAECIAEMVNDWGYKDGTLDNDDPDMLRVIQELETAIAMIRGRMRPRVRAIGG